jgi:hypothetical protein
VTARPAPMFRVRMAAHSLERGRWQLPARAVTIPAASGGHARVMAVREAHGVAGLPCWRPLVRRSLRYTTAAPVELPVRAVRQVSRRPSSSRARRRSKVMA